MEAQVLKSLGKLKKLLPRNQKELKDVIDTSTVAMTTALERKAKDTTNSGGVGNSTQVPFEPFLLAILTRQAKLVAIALDCIEKFLAFGFLQGNGHIPESIRKRLIQKYGKKAFSSTSEDSLSLNEEHWKLIDCIIEVICDANDHPDDTVQIQVLRVLLTAVTTPTCEVHEHSLLKAVRACYHIHLVSKTHTNQTVAKATLQQIISIVFQRMETFDQRVQEETEASLKSSSSVVASATAVWYPEVVRVLGITTTPKQTTTLFAPSFPSVLHKDAFLLFRSLCRISMRSFAEDNTTSSTPVSPTSSSNTTTSTPVVEDPFAFQSKLLSLELVLSILIHAGPSFRSGERFIHAIRQYLCQSLLQNCTSNYLQIVDVSLQLFMVLLQNFKQHLKSEVEIFITSIFLRLLQSEHATLEHKVLVVKIVHQICQDAILLGEIFLNYDCDWHTTDLFKQMMDVVAKMAKGKAKEPKTKALANDVLVLKGLECLTATVHSLKHAAHFIEIEKQQKEIKETEVEDILPPPPPPLPPLSSSAVEAFDRKKRRQEELSTGILQFNVKPSTGIQYLIQHGHLNQGTPRDVALFLHEHANRLDKTQVGDYLGKEIQYQSGFCVKTLHEYVDLMDFSGLEIDVAIRLFLSGFRLPGESQKIDRMMEKFAQRYYSTCPIGLFPSADTAFILSFSIIMLQTDLHNPSVAEEKKMTKDGFIRNNRGINNGEDLPEAYLGGIYDRIKQNPISLKEDLELKARTMGGSSEGGTTSSGGLFGPSSAVMDRQRRDAYSKERESMVRASEALFKRRTPGSTHRNTTHGSDPNPSVFYLLSEGTERSHIKPMFETIWAPLLACCSVLFESQESMGTIQLCLQAFQSAIHLSARLEMMDERDAFVSVLSKFTALHTTGSRLLKPKHMEAMKTLLSIAIQEGNYLGDAWRDVLQCLSQLARLQTHAQGLEGDFSSSHKRTSFTTTTSTSSLITSTSTSTLRRGFMSSTSTSPLHRDQHTSNNTSSSNNTEEEYYNQQMEDENATRVLVEIDSLAIDRVFSSSVSLSDHAIQEFVVQLCVVSLSECSGVMSSSSNTSVFSLQKLVEVADMNMLVRSRMVWSTTWKVLSRHFTTIGCHEHHMIAMYAIDSLRQLSMRFLEKAELKDFNFQRLFLTPFEIIISNAVSMDIKELVLRCIENIILARVSTIKSGWKTIWGVLRVAAETYEHGQEEKPSIPSDRIVQLGFQIATRLLEHHFESMLDVFVDAVECLVAFAVCGSDEMVRKRVELTQMSVSSIELLTNICLNKVATGQVIEKVLLESMGAKRVGFTKRKEGGEPSKVRYEKQESSRALEEEIVAMSPPSTPSHLHRRSTVTSTINAPTTTEAIYTDCAAHTRMWWPVLTALSTLAADRRLDVRLSALTGLFTSLETHGMKLSSGLWSLIFKGVLIPLLDELRHVEVHIEKYQRPSLTLPASKERFTSHQLTTSTSTQCLELILHLYGLYYDQIGFLPEILFLLGKCMDSQDIEEELATAAACALEQMLMIHGHKFPEDVWGLIADELRSVMTRAEPTWVFFRLTTTTTSSLLSPRFPSLIAMYPSVPRVLGIQFASTFPPKMVTEEEIRAQERPCQTHLVVILALQQMIATVLTSRETRQLSLSEGHATSLLGCLRESFRFARKLNDALAIRQHLAAQGWTYGRVETTDVPNVLWQEVHGKETYGRVLFHVLKLETLDTWKRDEWRRQMRTLVQSTLEEYLRWTVSSYERGEVEDVDVPQRVVRYTPLMVSLLTQLAQLSPEEMHRHLYWIYPLLNELIKTKNEQVRIALTQVYTLCIGQLLPLTVVPASPTARPMSSHGRPPPSLV